MNFLNNVSKKMKRYANAKYIIILFIMLIVVLFLMERGPANSIMLKALSGGKGMLDMEFGYNQRQVFDMMERLGNVGRMIYMKLLGIDFIFAVIFALLQSLLITVLLRKNRIDERFWSLNMLPFLRSMFDIVENIFLLGVLYSYPRHYLMFVSIASTATIFKWIIYYLIIGVAVVLGALLTYQALAKKVKESKL